MKHLKKYNEELKPIKFIKDKLNRFDIKKNIEKYTKDFKNIGGIVTYIYKPKFDLKDIIHVECNINLYSDNDVGINLYMYINKDLYSDFEKLINNGYFFQKSVVPVRKTFLGNDFYISIYKNYRSVNIDDAMKEIDVLIKDKSKIQEYLRLFKESIDNLREEDRKYREKEKEKSDRIRSTIARSKEIGDYLINLEDISTSHHNEGLVFTYKIPGIKVINQEFSESTYGRYQTIQHTFDEAKFKVTDELLNVFKEIKTIRERIKKDFPGIEMDVSLKNDTVKIKFLYN